MPRGIYERKEGVKRGKRGQYERNWQRAEQFRQIFKQMVDNARANFGILDSDGASQLLPNVPFNPKRKKQVSTFDLVKKIEHWHGKTCVKWFHSYFPKAKRKFDKRRLVACEKAYCRGELSLTELWEKRARCYTWVWVLADEALQPTTAS